MELNRRANNRTDRPEDARRARLILLLAGSHTWDEASERIECSDGAVASRSPRFVEQSIAALYCRHEGHIAPVLTPELETRHSEATRRRLSGAATHCSTCKITTHLHINYKIVARVWRKHRLEPHRIERHMPSSDPAVEAQAIDIIGLNLNPPTYASWTCVDEKTAIRPFNCKDAVLPLSPGQAERHGGIYIRHGTLSLYTAINTKTEEVFGKNAELNRSSVVPAFLSSIAVNQPRGKEIHINAENVSVHRSKPIKYFVQTHSKFHSHFTPTHSSWFSQIEPLFERIKRDVIARDVFTSAPGLKRKPMRYFRYNCKSPRTVKWKYADPTRHISTQSDGTGHQWEYGRVRPRAI